MRRSEGCKNRLDKSKYFTHGRELSLRSCQVWGFGANIVESTPMSAPMARNLSGPRDPSPHPIRAVAADRAARLRPVSARSAYESVSGGTAFRVTRSSIAERFKRLLRSECPGAVDAHTDSSPASNFFGDCRLFDDRSHPKLLSPDKRTHSGQQFQRLKRLDNVVISSQFK